MLMISEKATTLYVRSAISDIRELLGPQGSLDVASLTLGSTQKMKTLGCSLNQEVPKQHVRVDEISPFLSPGRAAGERGGGWGKYTSLY